MMAKLKTTICFSTKQEYIITKPNPLQRWYLSKDKLYKKPWEIQFIS